MELRGISDIEGKAATGSGERAGMRASFKLVSQASEISVCGTCGNKLFADAPQGLCSLCLFKAAVEPLLDEVVATGDDGGSRNSTKIPSEFGDYELLKEIGRGGQGIVYRARQKSLNRIVALKVIGLGTWATEAHLKRFRREAEAAARLQHPGIIPIHEVGERDTQCYFSMDFIEGGQLDEVVKHTPMPIRQAAELVAKVARTVHYAHEHGILHRDIKPGNILLDQKGEPHLADFGLARLVETESTLTRTKDLMGTPSYMAPEQAVGNNAKITRATDVYGLGAVLYQLLTGDPPFAGGTTYETIKLLLDAEPKQPRLLNPKIDRDLSTICLKCLEKDPKRRYSSALALTEDLEHWLKHEPILARRTGIFTRGRKWVRRNPTSALLAAALIALAAVIGWNVWKSESVWPPITNGIAVLPFENLSSDPENAFLSDGVQDEVLNDLAKVADLKVISRTSVMQYKTGEKRNLRKIANELGVAHVIEGSVQRSGNRVRVNAQLIDAKTDTHLWVESYDRPLDDVFAIQSDIAKAIADQLQAKLSAQTKSAIEQPPTKNLAAYNLYVFAKSLMQTGFFDGDKLFEAARLLDEAIARDPNFFLAYCLSAEANSRLYWIFDHKPARRDLVDRTVRAALHLRPEAGEAHLEQARYLYLCNLDYDHARAELALAQRKLPNNAQVFVLMGSIDRLQGHWNESMRNYERALELDPRNLSTLQQVALGYESMRRFAESAGTMDRAIAVAPQDVDLRASRASLDLDLRADSKPLHKLLDENAGAITDYGEFGLDVALCERDPVLAERALATVHDGFNTNQLFFSATFLRACMARAFGDDATAQKAFTAARSEYERTVREQPSEGAPLCMLGLIDAGLGRKEGAIREGRRASELTPVTKDAINGGNIMYFLGVIYAWTGEKDLAIKQIAATLQIPSVLSYGQLRLHPFWDPLRGDLRFERLVEEAKKPVALK
jgi:serine/threonine protein kinase/Tfp pilus assembly protein PilF